MEINDEDKLDFFWKKRYLSSFMSKTTLPKFEIKSVKSNPQIPSLLYTVVSVILPKDVSIHRYITKKLCSLIERKIQEATEENKEDLEEIGEEGYAKMAEEAMASYMVDLDRKIKMKEYEELNKDKEERKMDDGEDELDDEFEYYEGFKREELVKME